MTNTKHKPATALPWNVRQGYVSGDSLIIARMERGYYEDREQDAAYIAHACNAYPQLVAALRDLREAALLARTGAEMSYDAVQRADEVLRDLGELE